MSVLVLALAALPAEITVTATRIPEPVAIGAPIAILDGRRIDALGLPQVDDLIRLTPGAAVASSGPRGAQAQVRIRGAEANHTLLFIDGIKLTDPAAANEARFEALSAHDLDQVELLRGPQSALWGAEALGGVVAIRTAAPKPGTHVGMMAEYGSLDSHAVGGSLNIGGDTGGIVVSAGHQGSDGIDIAGGGSGDKDGYALTTVHAKGVLTPGTLGELGIVARYQELRNDFDGTDALTYLRADTGDSSRARTTALRAWATLGRDADAPFSATLAGTFVDSDNRNSRDGEALNRTAGRRFTLSAQGTARFDTGAAGHRLTLAAEEEHEHFIARDQGYFGATDQTRDRRTRAWTAEWRATVPDRVELGAALRHDDSNRFADATTLKANAAVALGGGLWLHGAYGEGFAQPGFTELYGFFPDYFQGNPDLKPERNQSIEGGIAWRSGFLDIDVTAFRARLTHEIVSTYDGGTGLSGVANATGRSRRHGIEVTAEARPTDSLRLSAGYVWLNSREPGAVPGTQIREVRRPRHSASASADWTAGPASVGVGLAYVGHRIDTDFDLFPAARVRLDDYLLASLKVGWRILPDVEAFGRIENLGGARYQDVVGYATRGRTFHAGLKVRFGD